MTDTKTNTKKPVQSKEYNLKTAMLEFQKLAVTAKKDGKNPHFKSNYSTLESVIEAVNQGNQFGLFFTQEIDFEFPTKKSVQVLGSTTEEHDKYEDEDHATPVVSVRTKVQHINDDQIFYSSLPIILSQANMENPQKIGSAITYAKRYTLQSVYGLPSEDDDGNKASEPTINISNSKKSEGVEDDGL